MLVLDNGMLTSNSNSMLVDDYGYHFIFDSIQSGVFDRMVDEILLYFMKFH